MPRRIDGEVQPGIRWGPFTARIPFYHFRAEWPEMVQGLIVAGATGLALIPMLQPYFGLSFEVALAVVIVQGILISTAPILFGDPYCHGWVTPSIPLVLAAMDSMGAGPGASADITLAVIHAITAFSLTCAFLFLVLGISGLGAMLVRYMPRAIKSGIILGAAISAFLREFGAGEAITNFLEPHTHLETKSFFLRAPKSCLVAMTICLLLMFSLPVSKLRNRYRPIAILAGLGLAPGFVAALIVGHFTGELKFDVQWGLQDVAFGQMFQQLSPISSAVGFPGWHHFVEMLPLALVVYIIAFGDLVTGNELLRDATRYRPDEKVEINPTRTHLNMGIRNACQAALCGPFPCSHGMLWTGVQVVVTHRYKQGRRAMDSLFGGISAYYVWGLPFLFFLKPVTSFLSPTLPIALSLTLLLTGYACGYIAMSIVKNPVERGIALMTGMVLALFGAWQGLLFGIVLTIVLLGKEALAQEPAADHGPSDEEVSDEIGSR